MAPSTRSWSSSPTRSRCCRGWCGITASRLPTRRRSRPITSPRWRAATSPSRSTATAATRRFSAIAATRRCAISPRLDRLPRWSRRGAGAAARHSRRGRCSARCGCRRSATSCAASAEQPGAALRRRRSRSSRDRDKEAGLWRGDALAARPLDARPAGAVFRRRAGGLVAGANWADLHTYLPDDLMVKVDVASMAHGLETRSPLLDHVLLEWAARIPTEVQMAGRHAPRPC